eukprot:TRINITY_DN34125_c0_g1_i1.p1 TRINITY_DN34125_c0_g1~~TRINITY_DN34125_c0_g1_i1.p1  ORF type:complete len:185 (+),score=25.55 TRINITY_DN34125_c0_g1_i1:75-629(+)
MPLSRKPPICARSRRAALTIALVVCVIIRGRRYVAHGLTLGAFIPQPSRRGAVLSILTIGSLPASARAAAVPNAAPFEGKYENTKYPGCYCEIIAPITAPTSTPWTFKGTDGTPGPSCKAGSPVTEFKLLANPPTGDELVVDQSAMPGLQALSVKWFGPKMSFGGGIKFPDGSTWYKVEAAKKK